MRSKVVLVKGFANLSPRITMAPFERINADDVVAIVALRYPEFVPEHLYQFQMNSQNIQAFIPEILDHWRFEDISYFLATEYANIFNYRSDVGLNLCEIKSVEGVSLKTPWFYECVKAYHRNFGQSIVECEVIGELLNVDQNLYTIDQFVAQFGSCQSLG